MVANAPDIGDDAKVRFDDEKWLQGLDGPAREERRKLLELLASEGFSEDQLRVAVAENRLALLPVDRVFGGALSARELERRSGLPAEIAVRVRRDLGLAEPVLDERVFSPADVDAARSTKLLLDAGVSEEVITEISAVLGEGMSRLAAAMTAAFLQTFLSAGDSEEEVALRFAQLAEQLTPALSPILVSAFNAHLRDAVRRGVLGRDELLTGSVPEQELCVCFADLVGFTRLGAEADLDEIGSVAGGLARLASAAAEPPVRLIKTIGDAAMLVCTDPAALVRASLQLVDAVADEGLPTLRAGIAFGPVAVRAGDYFGNAVNVASRVTGAARPASVLCTAEVRDACPDQFDWSFAGRHRLKGVPGPTPLYRARQRQR